MSFKLKKGIGFVLLENVLVWDAPIFFKVFLKPSEKWNISKHIYIYIYMHTERLSKSTKVWFINTHLAPILVIMHWILNCFSVTNTCCFLHKSDSFWGSCSSCWGWDVPKVNKLLWSSNPPEKKWSGPMGYFVPAAECRPEAAFGTLENT